MAYLPARWSRRDGAAVAAPARPGRADQRLDDLGAGEHAGDAGAGMRARAHEVEVGDVFAAVVRAKVGGLRQDRLEREGTAAVAIQCVTEVARVDHVLSHDMPREAGQEALLQ